MLLAAIAGPLLAALFVATQQRHEDRSADSLATVLAWLLAAFGLLLLTQESAPVAWQLATLFGTSTVLEFSLAPQAIGLGMAVTTLMLGPVAIYLGTTQEQRSSLYVGIFALQAALVGAFLAGDLATFYICFEGSLIPALWTLTRFGVGKHAPQAALRFLLYTMSGSFLMLVAIWAVAASAGTLSIAELSAQSNDFPIWYGLVFMLAFAVKTPLVPFHGWQRMLYESTAPGALVLIAGLMGKLGVFGFTVLVLPIFTEALLAVQSLLVALCLASVVFGALMALRATSWRSVLAYSSLSHLGFALLAVVSADALTANLIDGVLLHMVGHAIAVAGMLAVIAGLERRSGDSEIGTIGGLAAQAPGQASLAIMVLMVAVALPGTVSFTAEVMLLGAMFSQAGVFVAVLAGLSLVLTAAYLLRLARTVVFGPAQGTLRGAEVTSKELAAAVPLLLVAVILGFAPRLLLDAVEPEPVAVAAVSEER
jgi:NADH-quinone oxidoreductase subunit M